MDRIDLYVLICNDKIVEIFIDEQDAYRKMDEMVQTSPENPVNIYRVEKHYLNEGKAFISVYYN